MASTPHYAAYIATEKKVAETFLASLKNHDWDTMRTVLDADSTWSLPGESRISGLAKGIDAVVERAQTITSYGINVSLQHLLYGEDGFTLSIHNTATRGELVLDEYLATVCQMKDGKVFKITTYLSDVPMASRYFALGTNPVL